MLTELQTQNRTEARKALTEAAWRGEGPDRLLPLAEAAGMTSHEADQLVERVRQGREQIEHTGKLPALRKEAAAKKARFEKVRAHATAEIERLEGEMEAAGIEADAALKAQYAAENSARQLLVLHDEGLLPADSVPEEVHRLIAQREAEERSRRADRARVAALEERNRWQSEVRDIEARLASAPATVWGPRGEPALKARLKEARHELGEAEDRLTKAEAAADAARRAVPQL